MSIAVVYHPKAAVQMGMQAFAYPVNQPNSTAKNASIRREVELNQLILRGGPNGSPMTNFVDPAVWDAVEGHDRNKEVLSRMKGQRALMIYRPDAETIVGCSTDYTKPEEAAAIIATCDNDVWLQLSMNRDTRQQVISAASQRFTERQQAKLRKQQNEMALMV